MDTVVNKSQCYYCPLMDTVVNNKLFVFLWFWLNRWFDAQFCLSHENYLLHALKT